MIDPTQREPTLEAPLSDDIVRKHMVLTGILQGIGCRPTVYRLATKFGLGGWVINTVSGVIVEIEGPNRECREFEQQLSGAIPFPGRIDRAVVEEIEPLGERTFHIRRSLEGKRTITPIPPDVAVCRECVEELFTRHNPRYLYPFITCTLCGPRFTVVRSFPYDRERTSMVDFTMCSRCKAEYENPSDRRFHSQTNSCPECGPELVLTDSQGRSIDGDPMVKAIRLLSQGKIVAIKGIGGFHLACDALNENAVGLLRERKGREEKPLAVMMGDLATIKRYCKVEPEEEALLTSAVAPIVLLSTGRETVAPNVAPFIGTLGAMLPYSPLHHLLFKHPDVPTEARPQVLVMTSGNRSEEPIAKGNMEALGRLQDLADAFLMHNREIVLRADDSIFRPIAGRPTVFRRSRGLVPGEFRLEKGSEGHSGDRVVSVDSKKQPVVIAAGGDLKNALAVLKDDWVVPGPHVGDLASPVAQEYFKQAAAVLTEYLEVSPELVAVDPHPEYFSNSLAREMEAPVEEVYHHHAHAVSLLFEHGLEGPALFAVFDGTGYGTDGTIWGGEFLLADRASFSREAHIGVFPLPGGEAAIREPIRILVGLLAKDGVLSEEFLPLTGEYKDRAQLWIEAVSRNINSPVTSSAGRLFDAAAAGAGFTRSITFEGQAAMWLEGIADPEETGSYEIRFIDADRSVIDPSFLILQVSRDILSGIPRQNVAARFHNSIAEMVVMTIERLSEKTRITTVGLTGGCFQNRLLTERTAGRLDRKGFKVILHSNIPPNDGGLAIGQAVAAISRIK